MELAQIIVTAAATNTLLAAIIALQCWLVQRSFAQDKNIALLSLRMDGCKCQAGLHVRTQLES